MRSNQASRALAASRTLCAFPVRAAVAGGYDACLECAESMPGMATATVARGSTTRQKWAMSAAQSLVMAAVNWLGRVLPEAPLNVVEIDEDGMETVIPNHPAAKLWRRPNEYYAGTTLCKAYAYSWIVSGNPYVLKGIRGS